VVISFSQTQGTFVTTHASLCIVRSFNNWTDKINVKTPIRTNYSLQLPRTALQLYISVSIRKSVNIAVSIVKQYCTSLHTRRYAERYVTAVSTTAPGSRVPKRKAAFEADYPVRRFNLIS